MTTIQPEPGARVWRGTVVDPTHLGSERDVQLSAPAGTTLAGCRPALSRLLGWADEVELWVEGRPLDASTRLGEAPWLTGTVITLGRSSRRNPRTGSGQGSPPPSLRPLEVHRPPRLGVRVTEPQPEVLTPLVLPDGPSMQWLPVLLPALLGLPLALVLGQAFLMWFALLAPVSSVIQFAVSRRSHRLLRSRLRREHHEASAAAQSSYALARSRWIAQSHRDHPTGERVLTLADGRRPGLWTRRPGEPDWLVLRWGQPDGDTSPTPPGLVDFQSVEALGLVGPRPAILGLARCLMVQWASWHGPGEVRLEVLAGPGREHAWSWTAWLPHAQSVPAEAEVGSRRGLTGWATRDGRAEPTAGLAPATMVVVDGDSAFRRTPMVREILSRAEAQRRVLCLETSRMELPGSCATVIRLGDPHDGRAPATLEAVAAQPVTGFAELVSAPAAAAWARTLAPRFDAARGPADPHDPGTVPSWLRTLSTSLGEAGDARGDPADPETILRRWTASSAHQGLGVTLGTGADGPWRVDLVRDGPHALIAGTTGSGKSELLLTLIAGLAVDHPPERVTLLLADFKGGTAFAQLAGLPHVTAVVSDLDLGAARRVLACLRAELRRREAALAALEAADAGSGLPRLVVVVDEFRVLAEEAPDVLTGLVRIATVGRSLGVHLVLATQRPAGAVPAELRANVNLRIVLRVQDRMDSLDLLEVDVAAAIPPQRPGLGYARRGPGPPEQVQFLRVTGAAGVDGSTIDPVRAAFLTRPAGRPSVHEIQAAQVPGVSGTGPEFQCASAQPACSTSSALPSELDVVVSSIVKAHERRPVVVPPGPWLPPLPTRIGRSLLPAAPAPTADAVTIALADQPELLRQPSWSWNPSARPHLGIVGGPRSGRSTTLCCLVDGLLASGPAFSSAPGSTRIHLVAARSPKEQAIRARLTSRVDARDVEHCARLLETLRAARPDATQHPADSPTHTRDWLLIDDWEEVMDFWTSDDQGRLIDELVRLAREGPARGVHIVVAGGRAVAQGPVASVVTERIVLGGLDETEYLWMGVPRTLIGRAARAPGRGWARSEAGDWVEIHVALADSHGQAHGRGVASGPPALPAVARRPEGSEPVQRPTRLEGAQASFPRLAIGVWPPARPGYESPELQEAFLDLARDRIALLVGSPGSGVTTALGTIALAARRCGLEVISLGPGCSQSSALGDSLTGADLILVDDTALLDEEVSLGLAAALRDRPDLRLVAAGGPGFAGLPALSRGPGTGLLLGPPDARNADALGISVRRLRGRSDPPPGRGWLVGAGRVRPIQVFR